MYSFIGALIVVFAIGMLIRWAIRKRKASRTATPAEPPPPAPPPPGQPSVFCPQCGQPNSGDIAFCSSCGAKLK